jgi:hypothetical protein
VLGENNHPAFSAEALGCPLLALFDRIVRGLEGDSLSALIDRVLEDARASSDADMVKDLFVMAFQTRWCRGGKAEKLLFYKFIVHLYERFPAVVLDLMHLIPKYGYWKDLLSLLLECPTRGYGAMHAKVWSLFADQLGRDLLELETALGEGRTPEISLCAKYAPSEGGHHSKALRADSEICKIVFHGEIEVSGRHVHAKYRRMLSRLRTQLHLTETYMCAQRWNEIDFAKVPSLCMDRQKYAFLNEEPGGQTKHPDDSERHACREKLMEHLVNGGSIKGNQLFPHELVKQVCFLRNCVTHHREMLELMSAILQVYNKQPRPSIASSKIIDAQWVAVRNGLLEQVDARKRQLALAAAPIDRAESLEDADAECRGVAVGLSRIVPMVDISASMAGTPMNVAIALGILTSEVTHEAFRDKVLIFAETPGWIDLSGETTLTGKCRVIVESEWGFTTDFYLAMERICTVVRDNKLGADEIPDLLVISDMQFNDSQSPKLYDTWQSSKENVRKIFSDLGVELFGHPFEPPQLIFWNVRSNTVGYAAAPDEQGVLMLSGYSPALMKFVLSGEMTEGLVADASDNTVNDRNKWKSTPEEALRKILDDSGLDDVRVALNAMPTASFMCVSQRTPGHTSTRGVGLTWLTTGPARVGGGARRYGFFGTSPHFVRTSESLRE